MSEHPGRRLAGWILLALAGLAVAVALSVTASNLSTQPIGLSGEPLRAGEKLAPPSVTRTVIVTTPAKKRVKRRKPSGTQTTTTPTTTTPTTTTGTGVTGGDSDSDDHGRNRGKDGDDD
jgi:hypothetical protein